MQATLERLRERREEGGEGGFTLIELLIVIVILGILAAIVVFAVQNLTSQSAKASCGSDYKTVETALETYKAQVGHYPMLGTAGPPAVTGDAWATGPNATPTPGAAPSTFTDGVVAMFAPQTGVDGSQVGPWLKDVPTNGALYRIGIAPSADGSGDILVVKNLSTNAVSPAGATMGAPNGAGDVAVTSGGAVVNGTCQGVNL